MNAEEPLIAGEPISVLDRVIPSIVAKRRADGWFDVQWTADLETAAAWMRAIERYAADLITADQCDIPAKRQSAAFVRLVTELAEARRST